MRRFRLTLAFAIAVLLFQTQASRADCALLIGLQNWPLTAQQKAQLERAKQAGDRARVRACSDPELAGWLSERAKGAIAKSPASANVLAGLWVNEFWATVGGGLVVPNIETLEIASDGAVERRVVRFDDPATYDDDDANAEPKTRDLNPQLAKGVLAKRTDGRFVVRDLIEKDVELESGKRFDAALYMQRLKAVRLAMPDIGKPIQILAAGDRMAIRDAAGHIRTYRRYDSADVRRAHAIIMATEISGSMFWTCVLAKFDAAHPQRADLRKAGDAALVALAIGADMETLMAWKRKAEQAGRPAQAEIHKRAAGLFEKLEAHRKTPLMAFLQKNAAADRPFGCVRPFH